ncbi:MAG: anhydro-N-acetylmuramic acid kinase [Oscillospiraceae bacterium]|nr:anhydro-N-acetylmuramic acid kinase [Oscillospiraceae bacterium]MBR2890005.1 anhydro-N-acetylmuramic acid kinase [Oscillospiraceae bacterium]
MNHPFLDLWNKPSRLVVGLMSGTSADGIDAVLTRITGYGLSTKVEQLGFYFMPFDDPTRQAILEICGGESGGTREVCLLGTHLGRLYADAVGKLLEQTGVERIDLIGNHGQTVYHIPEEMPYLNTTIRGTLQIGDPSFLAERFGCPVVSDFRIRDMAAGGLGAPLVPYTEFLLYRSETEDVALQNIGGIGNVTLLPAGCALEEVTAFDTGPGNMVMDALVSKLTDGAMSYDDGGRLAASGKVNQGLLDWMLEDPYLAKQPPKTTGREYYGKEYVQRLLSWGDVPLVDVLTTATAFTAQSIALSLRRFAPRLPARLVVGGGGSRNPTLLAFLQEALPEVKVQIQEDLGLDSDAKEAVAFAILANEALFGVCNNAPSATGAKHGVVMGRINL